MPDEPATREELQAAAREWITDNLPAVLASEIEMPGILSAAIREVYGPRHTVFSAAGWGWVNHTLADAREREQA